MALSESVETSLKEAEAISTKRISICGTSRKTYGMFSDCRYD
jgi:hypothetical protein